MLTIDPQHLNKVFPKYPITVEDKGWIYGVWYCGTSFYKAAMYGQHPPTYLKRLCALFPGEGKWLHAPAGLVPNGRYEKSYGCAWHTGIDLVSRGDGNPVTIANAAALPFADNTFDVVESDPPYGREHEEVYGTPKYPRYKAMAEFKRVLKPGGYLAWLDVRYPSYKHVEWKLIGLIGVVTGFERVTRILSIFQKPA